MHSHAPLCVLPPCASSLLWAGRIRGLTLSPVSLCSLPALSCTHLDRPHDLSFRLSVLPMRTAIVLFPRCEPSVPLSRFDPSSRHGTPLPHPAPPVAIRRDKRTSGCPGASYAQPEVALLCPVCLTCHCRSNTHIAVPCHFASSRRQAAPHKTKRKESRGFPSSCQRGGHRASQILS